MEYDRSRRDMQAFRLQSIDPEKSFGTNACIMIFEMHAKTKRSIQLILIIIFFTVFQIIWFNKMQPSN